MENVIYDLSVKGRDVRVISNGQTFTSDGLRSGMWFDNDQYGFFTWDEDIDDNYTAYYELKPELVRVLKNEKQFFIGKLKDRFPQILKITEPSSAVLEIELQEDADFYKLIPEIRKSAIEIATFNTALLIVIMNEEFPFEFSINADVYRVVIENDFYQVTRYEDGYKTLFNAKQTETYAKSFFEEDIARFKIILSKIREIQDKRDKVFNS
ncbi:hypothetical protein [Pedobacter miscanthi]|uniref:hypothetical protein n=1 Tax=Pedobacter miscanthi TaxID=2259170 RepID=UPI00292CA5F9|nr:hypothetical protein [Pedobacter miscanthi]